MRKELYNRLMQKQAGTLEEALASAVTGAVPYVEGPVQGAGTVHGLVSPAPSVADESDITSPSRRPKANA